MQFTIVISLVFAVIIAFFAVQNAGVVVINFLWYKVSLSQAVVILCSALIGVLIMLPFDIIRRIKYKFKLRELTGENKKLKEEQKRIESEKLPAKEPVMQEKPQTIEDIDKMDIS
ncbi:MAG: LapA family protein [Clostridiaceae bacterium]|nr:LapA family protein [Clostridiaceae bacterium]HNR04112.1 LapA family protein [Bacillota bacterium]